VCLAVCYLELQEFEVITDHFSLIWLMKQQNVSGRMAWWIFRIQFYISHRKGKGHILPEAFSRICEEIKAITVCVPEVDLDSKEFLDEDYVVLQIEV